MRELKLQIELIPSSSWGKNLRTRMPQRQWDLHRKRVYELASNRCQICGGAGKLHCHEMWQFDDTSKTQTLVGFHAVCNICHFANPIGKAQDLADADQLDIDAVVSHFLKVNACDMAAFMRHKTEAFLRFHVRSQFEWRIDFGKFAYLATKKPLPNP